MVTRANANKYGHYSSITLFHYLLLNLWTYARNCSERLSYTYAHTLHIQKNRHTFADYIMRSNVQSL